jgi:hypothetical protein
MEIPMSRHSLQLTLSLFAASMFVAAPTHAAECFSMFDAKNVLVFQSTSAPIDLSRSISDEMTTRFPARYLVIADTGVCVEVERPIGTIAVGASSGTRSRPASRSRSAARQPL